LDRFVDPDLEGGTQELRYHSYRILESEVIRHLCYLRGFGNNATRIFAVAVGVLVGSGMLTLAQTADERRDEAIKKKLASPPLFLDEEHPGPTLAPKDLPKHIFPLDCRTSQAYLHRVSPGTYHFERAQYLLG